MEGQKIWASILAGIKSQISSSTFKTWFAGSFVLDYKKNDGENLLIVGVKNNFLKEQVETRYQKIIDKTVKKNGFLKTRVIFVVSKNDRQEVLGKNEPLFSGVAPTYIGISRKIDGLNPNHTFENFVVGSSNNLAFLAFNQVGGNFGSVYNPLFVYGPTGVGKTHLLQACGNAVLLEIVDAKVLYVSAEKFTNDYIESLRDRTMAAFRQKYRGVDLLLVDDVQFLAGKESTQDEFFYTFNELYLSGRQIVLAADRHPRELGRLKERLVSRFLGGMAVDVARPDLELRTAILKAKCRERKLNLNDEIIDYIARQCSNEVRELEGVLVQVLSLIRISGKISLLQIKTAIERGRKNVVIKPAPGKIIEAVSRHFKIASGDICGLRRKARLVRARQVLMYLLRQELGLPLGVIGDLIGGRDHSTVLYGIERVSKEMAADRSKNDEVLRIRSLFQ